MPVFKPKSGILAIATAGYDAAGRLAALSDGNNNSATYSYVANSPLVDHIAFTNSAGARAMTTSNTYDYLNCLTGKSSVLNFNYQYNAASQRTRVTLADGSYWVYGYDTLGQLTSGVKYFWDGTPYAGQQFGYAFDSIGNRTSTQAGGDQNGANLRQANYHYNVVNELTGRDVPGYVDVMGLTLATNTVQVNGANAYQKWEYFREQIATTNTNSAQWVGITVTAPGQATNSGCVFVPQTPEGSTYDLDGNLTKDGRWTYAWDGENRPISMTSLTNAPTASKYRPAFTYDYKGRRIQKIVSTNNGSGYVPQYTNLYLYDGWNLVAILDQSSSLVASFMWGTDLSGSMQGAGGVGGLLAENIVTNGVHFVAYDGNGNVAALVSATNGAVTANYEYGPFGELIRATGPMAKANPFGWSDKITDPETGLSYYGHRYYNPSTGRWLSRDPLQEQGAVNLYGYVDNDPSDYFDTDGQARGDGPGPGPRHDPPIGPRGGGPWPLPPHIPPLPPSRPLPTFSVDVDVYIYHWVGVGFTTPACSGSVGHALMTEAGTHNVMLSQFPEPHGMKEKNTWLDWNDTVKREEGRQPDDGFHVRLPDGRNVAVAVINHKDRPIWDWWPTGPTETHCAYSVASALIAGGLPIQLSGTHEILPDALDFELMAMDCQQFKNGAIVDWFMHNGVRR